MGLDRRRRFGFSGGELTAFEDERFGRGRGRAGRDEPDPDRRDRAAALRPDARHRRDDPAGTGRHRPGRRGADRLRAGRARHRQDGRRPAPGGLPAVRLRAAAQPRRRARRRAEQGVPGLHPERAARARRAGRRPAVGRRADRPPSRSAAPNPSGRRRSRATRGWPGCSRNALWEQLGEPAEAIMLARGSRRWRVPGYEIAELAAELRARGVRYGTGPGDAVAPDRARDPDPDGGGRARPATTGRTRRSGAARPVQAAVAQMWPKADPVRLVFRLLSDPELLARAADGILDAAEQAAVRWPSPPRGPGSARWTAADAVLIDEAADLIERTPSLAHIVVDEAQDLSPDAVPGHRPALRDRLGHRARRHRAGHDALGDRQLAADARPSRQAGRRAARARHRLPGAAADTRLRQPAARPDRAGAQPRRPRYGRIRARCWCTRRSGPASARRSRPRARMRSAGLARRR